MNLYKSLTDYLLENCDNLKEQVGNNNKFKSLYKDNCFRDTLNELFGNVPCIHFEQVISGEGNEREKINTVYSSSLQSLLIFSRVNNENPISICGKQYTEVHFEYKNSVITMPSSIDVVLSNKQKEYLFIESKLSEIFSSSTTSGSPAVGASYLSNHVNSYQKLGLENSDLKEIGINIPDNIPLYSCSNKKIKGLLKKEIPDFDEMLTIIPIDGNTYVYSEGIKQILAHIIGIININNPDSKSDEYLKGEVKLNKETTAFLSVYNALPNFSPNSDKDIREMLNDYKKHERKLAEILETRNVVPFTIYEPLSYQEIYAENTDYFKGMDTVVKFYHLNEKDPN